MSNVSEISLCPLFMVDHQLSGLDQILTTIVPAPFAGESFSQEEELLNYLLTNPAERSHVKSTAGDQTFWNSLVKHFLYLGRVAQVLWVNQFWVRSKGQLTKKCQG
ncbi:hypothetical protein KSP39_PZI015037 [Platanthera zijinensis]|uniref:Uncharacterized protein n=1 Tax=Platanthera zijinensis TaxID=2320716 RepID=A0AAP0G2K1_9ASPA